MRALHRRAGYVGATLLALPLLLAGCGDDDPKAEPGPSASTGSTPSSPAPSVSASPTESGSTAPTPHPSDSPLVVEPITRLLDWQPLGDSVEDTVTTNGEWTLEVDRDGKKASLTGPESASGWGTTSERVSDAFLDDDWAVVVYQDRQETDPARAIVTDLASGDDFTIDGDSDQPTLPGGTWALGGGHLLHATTGPGGAYCLASVDLATRASTLGWCADKHHGFNGAHATPYGDAIQTFDDQQPSCRTVAQVSGSRTDTGLTPLSPGCHGWDGVVTEDGAVWSVVEKENNVEAAHFFARDGDSYADLGPGTSGTLTWCHGAAYFVRDPQRDGDPARLMAWDGTDLTIVYESPAGQAFLTAPRCGGDTIAVTALAESGDEQVSAALG
jgi:hypothetical protein